MLYGNETTLGVDSLVHSSECSLADDGELLVLIEFLHLKVSIY